MNKSKATQVVRDRLNRGYYDSILMDEELFVLREAITELPSSLDSQSNRSTELKVDDLRALRFDDCYGNNFFCHEIIKGHFKIVEPSPFNALRTFIYFRHDDALSIVRTKQEFDELIQKLASLDRPIRARS